MEGFHAAPHTNVWSAVSCDGAQRFAGSAAYGTGRDAGASRAAGEPLSENDGVTSALPGAPLPEGGGADFSALPSSIFAALDDLAAAIGVTAAGSGAVPSPSCAMPGMAWGAQVPTPQPAPAFSAPPSSIPQIHTAGPASSPLPTAVRQAVPGNSDNSDGSLPSAAAAAAAMPIPSASPSPSGPGLAPGIAKAATLPPLPLQAEPPAAPQLHGGVPTGPGAATSANLEPPPLLQVPCSTINQSAQLIVRSAAESPHWQQLPPQPHHCEHEQPQQYLYQPHWAFGPAHQEGAGGPEQAAVGTASSMLLQAPAEAAAVAAPQADPAQLAPPTPAPRATPGFSTSEPSGSLTSEPKLRSAVAPAAAEPRIRAQFPEPAGPTPSAPQSQSQPAAAPPASPAPEPALPSFKAPTIASLRALRNSAAAAAAATAAGAPAPAPCPGHAPASAVVPAADVAAASHLLVTAGSANGSGAPAASFGAAQLTFASEGPTLFSVMAATPDAPAVTAGPTPQPAISGHCGGSNGVLPDSGGPLPSVPFYAHAALATAVSEAGGVADGAIAAASAAAAMAAVATGGPEAMAAVATGGPEGVGEPPASPQAAAAGAAEGLPSLLSADPEELAAAIAAAVAAVAAATRAATEAAGQPPAPAVQADQPQLQQLQFQKPLGQQLLLLPASSSGGEYPQQLQPQLPRVQLQPPPQQQLVYSAAMTSYELPSHLQQQPQQLQVQFVPAPHGGSGLLQVVAYGGGGSGGGGSSGGGGAPFPLVSEALPPAAAALLGTGLQSTAHAVVQQHSQYGEVVQVAWPAPGGPAQAVVAYDPSAGYPLQLQPQPQPHLDATQAHAQPRAHDPYYAYTQPHEQQHYQYADHQPHQQPQYGRSAPAAYDIADAAHNTLRQPTPYIYRPPAPAHAEERPPYGHGPSSGSGRMEPPIRDPRLGAAGGSGSGGGGGYVPLRHRAAMPPPPGPAPDGWRKTGRRTGASKQYPQHLLWSPPPSVLYTPTRDRGDEEYDRDSESPPPEGGGGDWPEGDGRAAAAAVGEETPGATTASEEEAGLAPGAGPPAAAEGGSPPTATQPHGPCSATVAAIQLIEARRKQAQAQALAQAQVRAAALAAERAAAKEQDAAAVAKGPLAAARGHLLARARLKDPGKAAQVGEQRMPSELSPPAPAEQPPAQQTAQDQGEGKEPVAEEQSEASTATAATPDRQGSALQEEGKKPPPPPPVPPPASAAVAQDALDSKPLGRIGERARSVLDAAMQAKLEAARRLRQQQLRERIQQERQRREAEEAARQRRDADEEQMRERLKQRLGQQQRAKAAAAAAAGAGGTPVLSKPQGSVAAALAARLAACGSGAANAAPAAMAPAANATAASKPQPPAAGVAKATNSFTAAVGSGGSLSEAELQDLEADLEALEQQIATTPMYGMNARALVLRAAELVARREAARPGFAAVAAAGAAFKPGSAAAASPEAAAADPSAALISLVKPLAEAVPLPERAFVTYVPRSSIPRLVRQEAAHSLTGGYLAIALQRARVPEARAVQAVSSEPELRRAAVAAAGQHEMALYRQVTSKMNYELLFRKTKAEPERLHIPEELLQSLNKTYGINGGKGKAAAGGVATPAAAAAAAAWPSLQQPKAASAGVAGGPCGLVMPGTKRRLASTDGATGLSKAAMGPMAKRSPAAAAAAVGAGPGSSKSGGTRSAAVRQRQGSGGPATGGAAGVAKRALAAGDELFASSSSDGGEGEKREPQEETGEARRGQQSGGTAGGGAATAAAGAGVAAATAKGTDTDPSKPVLPAGSVAAIRAAAAAAAVAAAAAAGGAPAASGAGGGSGASGGSGGYDSDGDAPDAPYEDLFGTDTASDELDDGGGPTSGPAESSGQAAAEPSTAAPPVPVPAQAPPAAFTASQMAKWPNGQTATAASGAAAAGTSALSPRQAAAKQPATGVTPAPAAAAAAAAPGPGVGGAAPGPGVGGAAVAAPAPGADGGSEREAKRRRREELGDGSAGDGSAGGDGGSGSGSGRAPLKRPQGSNRDQDGDRGRERSHHRDDRKREKRQRSRSRHRSRSRPRGGSGGGDAAWSLEPRGSWEGSAPPLPQQPPQPSQPPAARGSMSQEEWEQTEPRQRLRQQVLAFVHATLEPLYRAGLLGKDAYKRVAAKTSERLLSAHPDDTAADFLVREHAQISKFIMKVVEREQQRGAEQQQQQQLQQQ